MVDNYKLNLIAPVGPTGYGVVGYNVTLGLFNRGWDISLFPTGGLRKDNNLPVFEGLGKKSVFFHHNAPCLKIWHQFDLATTAGRGQYFAWPIFELDTFDKREVHHLQYPDKLIVCSEWAKQVIQSHAILQEIHVVPLGVDTNVFNPNIHSQRKQGNNNTIFLHAGKWEVRKGHDFMVDWFNDAFTPDDDVELWLMPHNPFLTPEQSKDWERLYLSSSMGKAGKITLIPWQQNQHQVAQIMAQADCGLFPARAEGWNLELLEMMAMGKQVITTNYSAHTEFCNKENAMLIECNNLESAHDGKWFFGQGNWLNIGEKEKEQGIEYMRTVHTAKGTDYPMINEAGIATGKEFSWANTIDKLSEIIYPSVESMAITNVEAS